MNISLKKDTIWKFTSKYKLPILILFLILINATVYYQWLSFKTFWSSDYSFQFAKTLDINNFKTWTANYNFGSYNLLLFRPAYMEGPLFGIFGNNNVDSNIADKFILFWPYIIFSGIGIFLLIRKVTNSNLGALIGSLYFCFNTYFLSINTQGHLLISIASMYMCYAIWSCIKSLQEQKIYLVIVSSLLLFIIGIHDFRIFYITVFFHFLYYIYFIITKKLTTKEIIHKGIVFSTPIITSIILNLYWILPSIFSNSIFDNQILGRSLFGNTFYNLSNAITTHYPFWKDGELDWFTIQKTAAYFWIIPLIAIVSIFINNKAKIRYFSLLAIVGIFLSKQVSDPFGFIYEWLFEHVIGFSAFREASKFYILTITAYAILIGAFVDYLLDHIQKNKIIYYKARVITVVILSFLFLINTKSVITGEIKTMVKPKIIHPDYLVLKNFILNQPDYFRTAWIPVDSRWGIYSNQKPKVNINLGLKEFYRYIIYSDKQKNIINENIANKLLDLHSIKYLIVPIEDIENDDNFFEYYEPRENYIKTLDRQSFLKKIDIGMKDVVIYENLDYLPHFYLTKNKYGIDSNQTIEQIHYQYINPTEYKITVKNISNPIHINFTESYSKDWAFRIGNFNWYDSLITPDYFMDKESHYKSVIELNSFYIDPEIECSKLKCMKNLDGTYNIDATIYHKTQAYMNLGIVIGTSTLTIMILILISCTIRYSRNYKNLSDF